MFPLACFLVMIPALAMPLRDRCRKRDSVEPQGVIVLTLLSKLRTYMEVYYIKMKGKIKHTGIIKHC